MPRKTAFERFQQHCKQDQSRYGAGCLLWTGRLDAGGYGRFFDGKYYKAHRWLWEKLNGPIPKGNCIMHSCDVRNCVNPLHLSIGTPKLNGMDMKAKGRSLTGAKHHNAKLTERQAKEIILAIASGERIGELAKRYNVSRMNITAISIGKAWAHLPRPPMHNRHRGNTKLPDYAVAAIRVGLRLGKTGRELARQFSVSEAAISLIKNRITHTT